MLTIYFPFSFTFKDRINFYVSHMLELQKLVDYSTKELMNLIADSDSLNNQPNKGYQLLCP